MNNRQVYNLFSFAGIMLLDSNQLLYASPEYLEEKSLLFLGKMGKDRFVARPSISFTDFWKEYCEIWGIVKDDYGLMNILNYLMSINFYDHRSFFDNFELYFGSMDSISNKDLRYGVHPLVREFLDVNINSSRYLKLKTLEYEGNM